MYQGSLIALLRSQTNLELGGSLATEPTTRGSHNFLQLSNQRGLIISEFGFSTQQTTLFGCVDGGVLSKYIPGLIPTIAVLTYTDSSSLCRRFYLLGVLATKPTRLRRLWWIPCRYPGCDTRERPSSPYENRFAL